MPSSRHSEPGDVKLTRLESLLYRAAQNSPEQTINAEALTEKFKKELLADQMQAINGLLKKSLFQAQKTSGGKLQYVATAKAEASMMGKLDENEGLVYQHIKDSRNEGIWTKQLKARTGLHQTIINRCLKSLEQKQLVKAVKSVKYPTRKIYMLYGLTPSIELSGGPWYTDNELDTGFINELSMACLNFIRSKSFPKNGQSRALFPTSHTSQLPSANMVHSYLRNSGLTETELELEHVVSLLDILVYDELVEKIPFLHFALGSAGVSTRDAENYSDSDSSHSGSDSGSDSESDTASDSGNDNRHKRKRSSKDSSSSRKKSKKNDSKSRKAKSRDRSRSRSRSRSKAAAASSTTESGSDSEAEGLSRDAGFDDFVPFVYRAIRPLSVRVGWTETPCGHCPVFDFCDESGPVNAESCHYYGGRTDELGRTLKHGWIDTVVDEEGDDGSEHDVKTDGNANGEGEGEGVVAAEGDEADAQEPQQEQDFEIVE